MPARSVLPGLPCPRGPRMKEILSRTFTPSMVLDRFSTVSTSFPISRSGRKSIYGYLRLDGLMSSSSIFSRARFLEVACLDLEALAEKRWMNSCSSLIFSSFLLVGFLHLLDHQLAGLVPEIVVSSIELNLAVVDICDLGADLI